LIKNEIFLNLFEYPFSRYKIGFIPAVLCNQGFEVAAAIPIAIGINQRPDFQLKYFIKKSGIKKAPA